MRFGRPIESQQPSGSVWAAGVRAMKCGTALADCASAARTVWKPLKGKGSGGWEVERLGVGRSTFCAPFSLSPVCYLPSLLSPLPALALAQQQSKMMRKWPARKRSSPHFYLSTLSVWRAGVCAACLCRASSHLCGSLYSKHKWQQTCDCAAKFYRPTLLQRNTPPCRLLHRQHLATFLSCA